VGQSLILETTFLIELESELDAQVAPRIP